MSSDGLSFVIPTLNAARDLERCLASIRGQRVSADRLEIIVVDGGSTDATLDIARRHAARILSNPLRRAEPGVKLGLRAAMHELRVVLASDNALPTARWASSMLEAMQSTRARGAFTHVVDAPGDSLTCRWFNRLHADPYNWFVYGSRHVHPARFAEIYPVIDRGSGWALLDLRGPDPPLLALAQGFVLRGDLPDDEDLEDDIAPLWTLIDRGDRFVYVDAGVHHRSLDSIRSLRRKYRARTAAALADRGTPARARTGRLSRRRKLRILLWPAYSLLVLPALVGGLARAARFRDAVWLLHPVGCLALAVAMVEAVTAARLPRGRARATP